MSPRAAVRARVALSRAADPSLPAVRRQRNVRPTRWETGEFVAVDGEGFSDGQQFEYVMGASHSRYRGRGHSYAYLAGSDGSSCYSASGGLSLLSCLTFLARIVETNPKAILVAFGASYDVVHMVGVHLNPDQTALLLGKGERRRRLYVEAGDWVWGLEYRPRKCLSIQRWEIGERRWTLDKHGKRVATPHLSIKLWDVWGFFQDSFVGVMKKWLPGDADYEMIAREKGNRSTFDRSEIDTIKKYNATELRCLVKIMERVRSAINDLGLKITRWDGAGAIAAAMLQKAKVKEHMSPLPPDVFEAARRAYSGGHIETCKIGYHRGDVHHYDINSAYPDQFRRLPSMKNGEWIAGVGEPPAGYTLVKVRYSFPMGLPFYPLFHRCENGTIIYPSLGMGWVWYPEYETAKRYSVEHGSQIFQPLAWYHFRTVADARPFAWVEDYYSQRQDYIRTAKRGGINDGPEKIIKLGLNALYGKTAQQVGARYDENGEFRLPPYFQLDWAGYVTAGCRAKLMLAAMQKPDAIIGFATDGLFSTEALDLDTPSEKELGAWEYQIHSGITVVMPGVYWLHDGGTVKHYSRGFDKKTMSAPEFVHDAWRRKQDSVPIEITRLVGMGSALMSDTFWKMRGCFVTTMRSLCLDGDNSKRYAVNLNQCRPERGLVDTWPIDPTLANMLADEESYPYPIAWLDGGAVERDLLEGEMADELEGMDAELA